MASIWDDLREGDGVAWGFATVRGTTTDGPMAAVWSGTVVSATDRLVRCGRTGRIATVYPFDLFARTEAEVWVLCADKLSAEATAVADYAAECRRKASPRGVVTV